MVMASPETRSPGVALKIAAIIFPLLIAPLLIRELALKRFPIHLGSAPNFKVFLFLSHIQEGLFVALILAAAGWIAGRMRNGWLRFLIHLPVLVGAVWLTVWALVRAEFSVLLSPRYVLDVCLHPPMVVGAGLDPVLFYPEVTGICVFVIVLAVAGTWLSGKIPSRFAGWVALAYLAFFLAVHLPVRAYVTYYTNRSNRSVLAMDDWSPLPLRSESLIPGLRRPRPTLPNKEDSARTSAYLKWLKARPPSEIPEKYDILWFAIESFRADAMGEETTPYLWQHRQEFQIRLDRNHWSGGNATQFGLFSIFTGLNGYHLKDLLHARIEVPFFALLQENKYRVRLANERYFDGAGSFKQFFAASLPREQIPGIGEEVDREMVDRLLADMKTRPNQPAADIVTFGATHWPYFYPPEDEIFKPVASDLRRLGVARSRGQVEMAHNRFRNASRFVDQQIARILETRRTAGALDRTVVIVTGDHGEEFRERGQIYHAGAMDDFQGRPVFWMRVPGQPVVPQRPEALTSHVDIVPTLLDALGFREDVLRTQGQSLLHPRTERRALLTSEQGFASPLYSAFVTKDYISRWHNDRSVFSFADVARRDGEAVEGDAWLEEAKALYPEAAAEYQQLSDPSGPMAKFEGGAP